jgi:hypothetical protein
MHTMDGKQLAKCAIIQICRKAEKEKACNVSMYNTSHPAYRQGKVAAFNEMLEIIRALESIADIL